MSFRTRARPALGAPGQLLGQKRRSGLPPPPDPENGSPAAVGTARGAEAGVLKEAPAKYLNFAALVQAEAATVIYDGQQLVGTIIKIDGRHDAFDLSRRCLGSFQKRIDAVRAIRGGAAS
jgi:hypothetical protein